MFRGTEWRPAAARTGQGRVRDQDFNPQRPGERPARVRGKTTSRAPPSAAPPTQKQPIGSLKAPADRPMGVGVSDDQWEAASQRTRSGTSPGGGAGSGLGTEPCAAGECGRGVSKGRGPAGRAPGRRRPAGAARIGRQARSTCWRGTQRFLPLPSGDGVCGV